MTKRDLKYFVLGATAMTLVIMADGYRRLREWRKTVDQAWQEGVLEHDSGDGVQNVQEPSEDGPWGRILSPWTADLFADDSKDGRADR